MRHAAFFQPLTEFELQELGRLVVNCGFVEFLLDIHAGMSFQLDGRARKKLISPMPTGRKIEIIESHLPNIRREETRRVLGEALRLIKPTIRARNYLLHGIWGMDGYSGEAKAVVIAPKDDQGRKSPEEITTVADDLALASEKLAAALVEDGGGTAMIPDRLIIEP